MEDGKAVGSLTPGSALPVLVRPTRRRYAATAKFLA